jgi:hypothetical protein
MYTTHRLRGFGAAALRTGLALDTSALTARTSSTAMQQIQRQVASPIVQLSTSAREAANAAQLLTRPGPSGDALAGTKCECYVDAVRKHAESQGSAVDGAVLAQLSLQCASDEAGFVAAMKQGGVGYEACKPIYARKSTWLLGGLVVIGALVVLR